MYAKDDSLVHSVLTLLKMINCPKVGDVNDQMQGLSLDNRPVEQVPQYFEAPSGPEALPSAPEAL
jgi:hypothetical protein